MESAEVALLDGRDLIEQLAVRTREFALFETNLSIAKMGGRTMKKFAPLISLICLSLLAPIAHATGDVEMQVEHLLVQAIDEYNQGMEAKDPAGWVKYFTDNVRRHSPLSDQEGMKDFGDYYAWEFKNFQAKFVTKKMVVRGRSASMVLVWEAVRRPSGAPLKIDMVGIFELATSGRIESMSLYYDTAKTAKLFGEATAASK